MCVHLITGSRCNKFSIPSTIEGQLKKTERWPETRDNRKPTAELWNSSSQENSSIPRPLQINTAAQQLTANVCMWVKGRTHGNHKQAWNPAETQLDFTTRAERCWNHPEPLIICFELLLHQCRELPRELLYLWSPGLFRQRPRGGCRHWHRGNSLCAAAAYINIKQKGTGRYHPTEPYAKWKKANHFAQCETEVHMTDTHNLIVIISSHPSLTFLADPMRVSERRVKQSPRNQPNVQGWSLMLS